MIERQELHLLYRPRNFDEYIGGDALKEAILSCVDRTRTFLFHGPRGCGKCVTGDTFVFTDTGLFTIDEIFKGIKEIGFSKNNINIQTKNGVERTSHFFQEETLSTIYIKDEYGFELEGTKEHPVLCISENCDILFKKLSEIKQGEYVCLPRKVDLFPKSDFEIKFEQVRLKSDYSSKKINVPKFLNEDLARLMGYITANGSFSLNEVNMSTKNKEIQADIKSILVKIIPDFEIIEEKDFVLGGAMFHRLIAYLFGGEDKLVTARFKSVPESILRSRKEVQINFLRGLIDCDSWIGYSHLTYCTASEILAKQVQMMLFNLGICATRSGSYNSDMDHVYWEVCMESVEVDIYADLIGSIKYKDEFEKHSGNGRQKDKIPYLRQIVSDRIKEVRKKLNVDPSGCFYANGKRERFKSGALVGWTSTKIATYRWLKEIAPLDIEWEQINGEDLKKKVEFFLKGELRFSRVVSVERKNEKKMVYDFTLPDNHNFISNGFISHNTTLARLIATHLKIHESDIHEIDAADKTGIDDARQIKSSASYAPMGGSKKIYIIDEVHRLSGNAWDSLLKTLEQPPNHCYFVLCTTELSKVPITIKSRAKSFEVKPLVRKDASLLLEWVCENEQIKLSDGVKNCILDNCEGIPREIIIAIDMVRDVKRDEDALELIASTKYNPQIIDLCRALIAKKKWPEITAILSGIADEPESIRYAVLGYMNSVLMKSDNAQAAVVIMCFTESFMYSKKAGLTMACYSSTH